MKDYARMTRPELLRRIAELEKTAPGPALAFAHERLAHDPQVHQMELETQNRELREAQQIIELSRDSYADLFDFAPVGYVTLDEKGVVREINLTVAGMLGVARTRLVGVPFHLHVAREDLAKFRSHLRVLSKRGEQATTELRLVHKGREFLPVEMQSVLVLDGGQKDRLYRMAIMDLTARKHAEMELHTRSRQQQAIAELGQHALEGRNLAALLEDAVEVVPQILGVEFCKVMELTPDGKTLLLRAGSGWKEGLVGQATVPAECDSQAGFTLVSCEPVIVKDQSSETRFRSAPLLLDHGVISGMSVVIHARGKPFGVLGAHTKEMRNFTGDDVHFLQSVANVLAAAIERQQLEEELLDISGCEQQRIGEDLHDGICQELVGIEMMASLIARELPGHIEAKGKIAQIAKHLNTTIRHARMLSHGLMPVQVEANGLMSALHELASTTEQLAGIWCRFVCDPPVLIEDNAAATHLYRIAQEAIQNAIKHGAAKRVTITLASSGDRATLTIVDDGSGLPAKFDRSHGMGLRIMDYRAGMIGGRLSIGPGKRKGTRVVCTCKI